MRHYGLIVTTPPADRPVSLDQAKAQCRVELDETYHDLDIAALIDAATATVESRADMSLCEQELRLLLPRFPRERLIWLPRGPVSAVESITYIDGAGDEQTLDEDFYVLSLGERPQRLQLADGATWPTPKPSHPNAVQVNYTAGAASPAAVGRIATQLILFLVAHWFRNREAVSTEGSSINLPFAAEALLEQLAGAEQFIPYGVET